MLYEKYLIKKNYFVINKNYIEGDIYLEDIYFKLKRTKDSMFTRNSNIEYSPEYSSKVTIRSANKIRV